MAYRMYDTIPTLRIAQDILPVRFQVEERNEQICITQELYLSLLKIPTDGFVHLVIKTRTISNDLNIQHEKVNTESPFSGLTLEQGDNKTSVKSCQTGQISQKPDAVIRSNLRTSTSDTSQLTSKCKQV